MSKSNIRQPLIQKRKALDMETHISASAALCQRLQQTKTLQQSKHVAVYLSKDQEIDLKSLIESLWEHHQSVYLPILHPVLKCQLWFAAYDKDTPLITGAFDLQEPAYHPDHIKAPWELDVICIPLVGFDHNAHRLGRGGGYYDRSLAFCHPDQRHPKHQAADSPTLIGCAYEFQRVEQLPKDDWDIQLDMIMTELKQYPTS